MGTYLAEALKNTSIEGVLHEKTVVFFDEKPEEEGTAVLDGLAAEWKRIKAER